MKGWKEQPLEELTEPDSPITYGVVKPGVEGDVLFVRGGDLTGGRVLESQLRTITQEVSDQYKRTLLRGGELLICLVGQPGQVAVAPESLAGANIARQVGLIRLGANVDSGFLSYFLQSPDGQQRLGTYTGGSVQQVINLSDLRTVLVPVPPLAEQQRIVGVLDEAMAGIATARAHAETNLQNARALFESHLQAVFTQRGPGWVDVTLADVLAVLRNGMNCKQDKSGVGSKVSRIESIWNARFDITRVGYAEIPNAQKDKFLLHKGDVLFSHINSAIHVGKTALFDLEDEVVHGVNLLLMRTKPFVLPGYLDLYLKHIFSAGYWLQVCKQSINQASVNQQDINRVPFRYPDLERQEEIVTQLDALSAETQRLASLYERKRAALEALKKSLLHQAFAGQL